MNVATPKNVAVIGLSILLTGMAEVMAVDNCFAPAKTSTKTGERTVSDFLDTSVDTNKQQTLNRANCLIDTDKLKTLRGKTTFIYITPRDADKQISVASDLLSIPLNEIKLKTYLKDNILVLVSNGFALHDPLSECGKLRQQGFKHVYVLMDGITALAQERKDLRAMNSSLVDARDVFREREDRAWLVVLFPEVKPVELKRYLPTDTRYVTYKKMHGILQEHKQHLNDKPHAVLFVDKQGEQLEAFQKTRTKLKRSDVYYLSGGVETFNRFIRKQYLMTSKREFVLQKPRSCAP